MFRKVFIISFLSLFITIVSSCKKEIPATEKDFVGTWTNWMTGTTKIEIRDNGRGIYDFDNGSIEKHIKGRTIFKNNDLIISWTVISKKFHIDKAPSISEYGYTYMILDNEEYVKMN